VITLNLISGLGADEKVFERLDLSLYKVNHIKWIRPEPKETLQHYSIRLIDQFVTTEPYIIIGLSFGGIITSEILDFIKPKPIKSIIISSVRNRHELPYLMQKGRIYPIHRLIPNRLLKIGNPFLYWYFGLKTGNQKKLLNHFLSSSDPIFVKWAINEIVNWKREKSLENVIHIHGNKDKVFPIGGTEVDHMIKNGSHLMIYTHANLVSKLLNKIIISHTA